MAKTEVEKLREKYKSRIAKSKRKKSGGGLIVLLVFIIIAGAIFGYFKFYYETPESKELREKIGMLEDEYRAYKGDWEDNKIAINELNKINDKIDNLYIKSQEKIAPADYDVIHKEYNGLLNDFDNIKIDLTKTREIPADFEALREELDLYNGLVKKPSKEEKKSLDDAQKLYQEAQVKLEKAETIEDLNEVFEDTMKIKSYLVIFKTKVQIKEAEWKEELSKVSGNVIDFDKGKAAYKDWIECYSDINKLWGDLKKAIDDSKVISAKEFNLKNLSQLKKLNETIDKKFVAVDKTVKKFAKEGKTTDLPCEAAKKLAESSTGPAPKPVVVAPEIIPETFKPAMVSASLFPGSEKQAEVQFEVTIDEEGNVSDPKVTKSSGNSTLDAEAEKVVLTYKFKPGRDEDGKPAKCISPGVPVMLIGK